MKQFMFLVSSFVVAATAYAGGIGGSNPPARESLELILMAQPEPGAGLFTTDTGNVGLGVRGKLGKEIVLSKSSVQTQSLTISDADFEALSTSRFGRNIDAVSLEKSSLAPGEDARSYQIHDGDQLGELVLKDRLEIIRSSVK